MKKILILMIFLTFGFSQDGTDHSDHFFSTWWKEVMMVPDTTFNLADTTQPIQDGFGYTTPLRISADSIRIDNVIVLNDTVTVRAPLDVTGDVDITGDLAVSGNINFISVYNIAGADGIFSAIYIGNSNMDGAGSTIADTDTASSASNKSWNNVANAFVTMDYAKTANATEMNDEFTTGFTHPPFHTGKAVVDKYGIESRAIIRATGSSSVDDWVPSSAVYYDSVRTQLTASGITEIDAVFIHLGDVDEDDDNKVFTDSLHLLLRQLWAEPEIDSMRTKIIFSELAYNNTYDGQSNYQNGVVGNVNYIFHNPYVGTARCKYLPNNGGADDVHFTAKSNVIRGRERFFGALEALPMISDEPGIERVSLIQIVGDGTFLDINDASIFSNSFQFYTLVDAPNLGKGATVGDFTLSASGELLTIDFDDNLIQVTSAEFINQDMNNSSTVFTYFADILNDGTGNMKIRMYQMGTSGSSGGPIDMLAVGFQNLDKCLLRIEYLTQR